MLPFLLLGGAFAASESQPHFHRGVLKPYELRPPDILLSTQDERLLKSGRAVTHLLEGEGDARRMIMVQDIKAPSQVVLSRIMDFEKYDEMVSNVDSCVNYASYHEGRTQTIKSAYEISALHFKFKYFMRHTYDPVQRCVVFSLDYDRRSDLDDSVGYWYVQPGSRNNCRVFYSCECKLRGWVPRPVINMLQKEALKKATTWVNDESLKQWHASRACATNDALVRFVDNIRSAAPNLKLHPRLAARHRAAVQFVSNVRTQRGRAKPISTHSF